MFSLSVMFDSSVTPWTIVHQALLSMEVFRQEYWRGLPFPTPGDLPDPGIKPMSLASPALAGESFNTEPLGKPYNRNIQKKEWETCSSGGSI